MKKRILSGLAAICMIPLIAPVSAQAPTAEKSIAESAEAASQEDRIYCIASVSKTFTAAATMQLVDEGKIQLDAPITEYLPDFSMEDERYKDITVRMLLNHTIGITNGNGTNDYLFDDTDTYVHDRVIDMVASQRFKAAPGEYASYSNVGFILLERIIENVSGMSYTDYIIQNVAAKVGAYHTGTGWSLKGTEMSRMQVPLYSLGSNRTAYPYEMALGTGGVYSTAPDVANFGAAFFTGNDILLSEEAKTQMRTRWSDDMDLDGYGLGWDFVEQERYAEAGVNVVGKGGDEPYMHSFLLVAPDEQISTAVLTAGNLTSEFPSLAAQALMDVVLEERGIEVSDIPLSEPQMLDTIPEEYRKYEGLYIISSVYGPAISRLTFDDHMMYRQDLGVDRSETDKYRYTADGTFVQVTDSGKMTSDRDIIRFDERNGRTYIKDDHTMIYTGLGNHHDESYVGERLDENPVDGSVQQSWDEAAGKKYVLFNEKWSSQGYESPFSWVITDEEFPGYVMGVGSMGAYKAVKMTDENTAVSFTTIPSTKNRDLYDLILSDYTFADGTSVRSLDMNDGKFYRSTDTLPVLTGNISEIHLTSLEASWYRIGADLANSSIIAERPENSSVYVYNRFGEMVWNSFLRDIPADIPLPEDGYIVFIGETGDTVTVRH